MVTVSILEKGLTESSFSQQCVGVLEGRRLPPCFTEVIRKQTLRSRLLTMPVSDSPQTLKDVFLSEGEIVDRAVNRVSFLGLAILIPSHDFKLCFLPRD